jgi:hypothetical protein
MSEYISLYSAFLVLLGMFLHCREFFTHDSVSLLNLFHGLELSDTWLNFFLTKCAAYLCLAGFLKALRGPNMLGACAGALLLATHPLFSVNSSRLGIFIASGALVWWLLVLAREKKSFFYSALPAVWVLLCAFSLSPWMLVFLPFCANRLKNRLISKKIHIALSATALLFLLLSGLILRFHAGSESWLKPFFLWGHSLGFIYHDESFFLFILSSSIAAWFYPVFILSALACVGLSMSLGGLDLGGILCLWSFLSGTAVMAFNELMGKSRFFDSVWKKAFLLVIFFAFVLQFYHHEHFDRLLAARGKYSKEFHHQCGQPLEKKGVSGRIFRGIHAGGSSGECWLAFGNYHTSLPGKYEAKFRLIASGAEDSYIDVTQENGKRILARKYISEEYGSPGTLTFSSVTIDYDTADMPFSPVEHRVHYGGKGLLYFEGVKLEAKSRT